MQELITSFIIQSKECRLRGIGRFEYVKHPAQSDIANKQLLPPVNERIFKAREERISDELIRYVANKNKVGPEKALEQIKEWCAETKLTLQGGKEIILDSLGILKTNQAGSIIFEGIEPISFFGPVTVERVVHKNSTHQVLVGDRETNSSVMSEFYKDEEETEKVTNNSWKIVSLVLGAAALVLLIFYFYNHSFSVSEIGNHEKVASQSPSATYAPQ
ncbi:MAG TPA: hypothetical protein VIJ75_06020 [Hanamia sp.]